MREPTTGYARNAGVNVAYRTAGDGPPDIVVVAGWLTHLDLQWEDPGLQRLVDRIVGFGRYATFDKRGVGLSDRVPPGGLPPLEERIDDLRAVMEAIGASKVHLVGVHEAGPMCMLFAATHPELVAGLVLYGTWAKGTASDDYPWAQTSEDHERLLEAIDQRWGQGIGVGNLAPSRRHEPGFRDRMAKVERSGATPGTARALVETMAATDVRHVLPSITVPTLVLHRLTDRMVHPGNARYLAAHIPGAELVELATGDHFVGSDPDPIVDEVERFVTGRPARARFDRVLATVLFTDIEGSTALTAELGDRRMRELLDRHDQLASELVADHRGRVVKQTGDGVLATFDGPARAIRCARAFVDTVRTETGLEVRAGLHTGEVEERGDDVSGIAVNLAARVAAEAGAGQVLVSRTLVDLVAGSGLRFTEHGTATLRGVPGEWELFEAS